MKVYRLRCARQHEFEGWFACEADYTNQLQRQLLSCPVCGDTQIEKMLSAPRLNLHAARNDDTATPARSPGAAPSALSASQTQAHLLHALRQVQADCEDVGKRFADQARAMHHGDIQPRSIRGSASPAVAQELIEEGIPVLPMPDLPLLKQTLQ
ncbi:DUF1178 family protein [Hydrogenophaga sp.]|uniref:DUF1178 family protein n=1 Tax=Hydrogenophaga sp. TaxID=1904254 RepID=UPI001991508B|nr:DUF1178 family protein [Hydrogenophaga sp.]MBD3893280.1 DUF1178 family protein [Hydrogenophaga sp.]